MQSMPYFLTSNNYPTMLDFTQLQWNAALEEDCRQLVRLAMLEDLHQQADWTTVSIVPEEAEATATIGAREVGVLAGAAAVQTAIEEMGFAIQCTAHRQDGDALAIGDRVATLSGPARDLLTAERTLLNLLGRLSGIATHTRRHVDAIAGSGARLYDTRKTTPGWRRLEKYAVRCGGGTNHRTGLFDAILIKDNHLAQAAMGDASSRLSPAQAVEKAREFVNGMEPESTRPQIIEIEVDTLEQLAGVLPASPTIVLLDNMSCDQLRQAVALRNDLAPQVQLEASGGVTLATIADIAATGVDRISVGALTHSAINFDLGLDWA